jgi:hypothetical protein
MNVLLIYPKFPDTFWSFTYALSFIGKKAAFPPLGLLTVATLLPAQWSKRLVDVNVDSLTECHKTQNKNRDLLESVKIIHRSGLQVMGGFIVGFDSDRPSIFQRQIDFIQKSGIITAMVGMLQAPPGTRLFDRLQRESRVVNTFKYSAVPFIFPFRFPARGFGQGAFSLLATDALDPFPQAQTDTSCNNFINIRLPLPSNMRTVYSLSRAAFGSLAKMK